MHRTRCAAVQERYRTSSRSSCGDETAESTSNELIEMLYSLETALVYENKAT